MRCIDVLWLHEGKDEPIRLVSELDEAGYEVRKLEFFRDGRVGWAWAGGESPETGLGEGAIPPLEEINRDPEFRGVEMDPAEFERLWRAHSP